MPRVELSTLKNVWHTNVSFLVSKKFYVYKRCYHWVKGTWDFLHHLLQLLRSLELFQNKRWFKIDIDGESERERDVSLSHLLPVRYVPIMVCFGHNCNEIVTCKNCWKMTKSHDYTGSPIFHDHSRASTWKAPKVISYPICVVPKLTAWAILLEIKILRLHPWPTKSEFPGTAPSNLLSCCFPCT